MPNAKEAKVMQHQCKIGSALKIFKINFSKFLLNLCLTISAKYQYIEQCIYNFDNQLCSYCIHTVRKLLYIYRHDVNILMFRLIINNPEFIPKFSRNDPKIVPKLSRNFHEMIQKLS